MFHLFIGVIALDGGILAGLLGIAAYKAMRGDVVLFQGDAWHRSMLYCGAMILAVETIATLIFDTEHPHMQFPFGIRIFLTALSMGLGTYALFPMLFEKNQRIRG